METVFIELVNMSINASWLILAVIILRLLLKKAPKFINMIMWAMVGVRLMIPFSIKSVLSVLPSADTVSSAALLSGNPMIHSGIPALNFTVNPIIYETFAPNTAHGTDPMAVFTQIASIIWVAGAALICIYAVISYIVLKRRIADAINLKDNLWQSEKVTAPFVVGFIKPKIYLPYDISDGDMEKVLAHENGHIKRMDHIIKPAAFILLAIHWFNPFVWMAYALLCRDIELACDERAVKNMSSDEKKAYSEALLSCSIKKTIHSACPIAFGEVGVKKRIKSILNYKKPALWIIISAFLMVVIVAACFLTDPMSNKDAAIVVGEYDAHRLGGDFLTSGNDAYEIGANKFGMPIFKNTEAAYRAALEDYAEGFAQLEKEFNLPKIDRNRNNYQMYKVYGWQSSTEDENVRYQCRQITLFFDLYENSFDINAVYAAPATKENTDGAYTGGAFVGMNLALSFVPMNGHHFKHIILIGDTLTIITEDNNGGYLGFPSNVETFVPESLAKKLEMVYLQVSGPITSDDIPKGDITVYTYESDNEIACQLYLFDGVPTWYGEGESLRLYEIEPSEYKAYAGRTTYLSPLSSASITDDMTKILLMSDNEFILADLSTAVIKAMKPGTWEKITEAQWNELFMIDGMAYESVLDGEIMWLEDGYYLVKNPDGVYSMGKCHNQLENTWEMCTFTLA